MKIAIIIRKLNIKGGVQRHVLSLAEELGKAGHSVLLYTFIYSKENCHPGGLKDNQIISLNYLPSPGKIKLLGYFLGLLREKKTSKQLAGLIDKDTDILNPHDHVCYKVAYFFKKSIKDIPSVWTMHDMPTKTFSYLRAKELNPDFKASPLKKIFYKFVDRYETRYIKKQDKIAVLDNRDKDWVKKYFKKDAEIVRNGVDLNKFSYLKRNPIKNRRINILMNGIFMPHRRFEDGIQAFKTLIDKRYDARLTIVGGYDSKSEYFKKITKLVDSFGLKDKVIFSGKVSDNDLVKSYEEGDIFVFPNHLQSWGLVVFEAMAKGVPTIVSKSAGASEILRSRETALLVNPKSPEEIASNIQHLIQDHGLYLKISAGGRRFVEKNISWERLAKQMIGIFTKLASKCENNTEPQKI